MSFVAPMSSTATLSPRAPPPPLGTMIHRAPRASPSPPSLPKYLIRSTILSKMYMKNASSCSLRDLQIEWKNKIYSIEFIQFNSRSWTKLAGSSASHSESNDESSTIINQLGMLADPLASKLDHWIDQHESEQLYCRIHYKYGKQIKEINNKERNWLGHSISIHRQLSVSPTRLDAASPTRHRSICERKRWDLMGLRGGGRRWTLFLNFWGIDIDSFLWTDILNIFIWIFGE